MSIILIAVNPQASADIWILGDANSTDKMFRLHQIREQAKTNEQYQAWFTFSNFDVFMHTAIDTGFLVTQIQNALISMLNSHRRLPSVILICMSDRLMHDKVLQHQDIAHELDGLCRNILRLLESWMDSVHYKVLPTSKPQIYITKPIPKQAKYFANNDKLLAKFGAIRRDYNNILVSTVKKHGIGFINVGITAQDGHLFNTTKWNNRFALNDKGLKTFWIGVDNTLQKLSTITQECKNSGTVNVTNAFTQTVSKTFNANNLQSQRGKNVWFTKAHKQLNLKHK